MDTPYNNNQRFPGQLYLQILSDVEPKHESEWAADKILSHAGVREHAIFKVLLQVRDKTWLLYNQVIELGLISTYLDAQGVEKITELIQGMGMPPINDPQVFLGSLTLEPNPQLPT